MNNKLLIGFVFVGGVALGTGIGCLIPMWCKVNDSFYNIKLIEVIQLLITISLAFIISYFVSGKIGRDLKRREMLSELVSKLQVELFEVFQKGNEYIEEPDKKNEKRILIMIKNISMLLGIVQEKSKFIGENNDTKTVYQDFIRFKKALTDTPFGREKPNYSEEQSNMIEERYYVLCKRLHALRLQIYS